MSVAVSWSSMQGSRSVIVCKVMHGFEKVSRLPVYRSVRVCICVCVCARVF